LDERFSSTSNVDYFMLLHLFVVAPKMLNLQYLAKCQNYGSITLFKFVQMLSADIRQTLLLKIAIIVSSYLQSKKKKY